jgi:ribosomal protein L17
MNTNRSIELLSTKVSIHYGSIKATLVKAKNRSNLISKLYKLGKKVLLEKLERDKPH